MAGYEPRWDINAESGAQAQTWVVDIIQMLKDGSGSIEVKRDAWVAITRRLYIEKECLRQGEWVASGLQTTEAKLWAFVLGPHPGILFFCTDWLRRAEALAAKHPGNAASCKQGSHPTRGTYVYMDHFFKTRDVSRDEH